MAPKEKKKHKKKHKSRRKHEEIHELSHYLDDRLKLMKEVVKIMKPKKIKSMAPEFLKDVKFDDLMFLLMDELLGISKKRLKYIFSGKTDDVASSSCTDSEEEEKKVKQPQKKQDDVISLSDITSEEDDELVFCNEEKVKVEAKEKHIKKEKGRKIKKTSKKPESPIGKEKLMSVLELLELQARARAIRSQLALETKVDKTEEETNDKQPETTKEDSDPEAVILQSPKKDEIVISSSDSEGEGSRKRLKKGEESGNPESWGAKPSSSIMQNNVVCGNRKTQKVKIIRERSFVPAGENKGKESEGGGESNESARENRVGDVESSSIECNNSVNEGETKVAEVTECGGSSKEEVGAEKSVVEVAESDDTLSKVDGEKVEASLVETTVGKSEQNERISGGVGEKNVSVENRNSCSDNERSDNEPDIIVINLDDSDDLGCD